MSCMCSVACNILRCSLLICIRVVCVPSRLIGSGVDSKPQLCYVIKHLWGHSLYHFLSGRLCTQIKMFEDTLDLHMRTSNNTE